MAATSALGFEPVLSESGAKEARGPLDLFSLEEEEGEKEEDEDTDKGVLISINLDIPNWRLASANQSLRNLTRKSVLTFSPWPRL